MNKIDFDVLMSVYKNDDPVHFDIAMQSVVDNTMQPKDIILVLDGPVPDRIVGTIEKYKKKIRITVVALEKNVGLGKALNAGIKYCSSEWIARFDSDDICFSNRFEKQLNIIKSHPDLDLIGSAILEFNKTPDEKCRLKGVPINHLEIIKYSKKRNPFNHMTVMYKKQSVLAAGGYQNNYLYEDYCLWVRMILNNAYMKNIAEPLVYVRVGNGLGKRRGGMKYAQSEFKAQLQFKKWGFLTTFEFMRNIMFRMPVRLVPTKFREYIYNYFLRTH